MMRLLLPALLGLSLVCGNASAQKDDVKKDAPKVGAKGQDVKVKSVDPKTNTLIVTTSQGKTLTFKVDRSVDIVGPRGGKSEDGLKDERLSAGSEITLFLAADMKTLKQIKLGFRKKAPEKDKPAKDTPVKDKPLEKDKKDKP
jgi:hypothetical protein